MPLPFESIPGPKPLPIIGNIWRYFPIIGDYDPNNLYENAKINRHYYGPIVREKITDRLTILHLFDPNDIRDLKDQDGSYPQRRSHRALKKYRNENLELYRDGGLFPENGKNWLRQRNLFKGILSPLRAANFVGKLDRVCLRALRFEDKIMEDFEKVLYKLALGNSLCLFLNKSIDELDEKLVAELIQQLHKSLESTNMTETRTDKWIEVGEKCPYFKMLAKSQDFLHKFVTDQIENYEKSFRQPETYLDDWLYVEKLDRRDIVSFIIDALMAGLHTTSYTMAFLMYYISRDEDLLTRLRNEINFYVLKDKEMNHESLVKLALLNNCLKETMRLNPISIGTGRLTSKDITLRNTNIPKGTMIIAQTQAISRDKIIFDEPDTFNPDRWTHYKNCPNEDRPSPYASLPFGFGARSCIGQRLAKIQILVATARFFQNYNIAFQGDIPSKTTLIHNLDDNMKVKVDKVL